MKIRFKQIASNSIFQSAMVGLLVTLLVIFIWDAPIKKYHIELEPFAHKSELGVHWFAGDFNGDGNSERIRCFKGINAESMDVVHYDKYGNLTANYHFPQSNWIYELKPKVLDFDNDGTQELLFITTRNDSIFINAFNLVSFTLSIDHLYFNTFEIKKENYAHNSKFGEFGDFDKDGKSELFFYFDAGFGLYPRGVFKLEFPSLNIQASPTEYMCISSSTFKDLNFDDVPEILVRCGSPSNAKTFKKYTDNMSYISVLDYNLNFIFQPIAMHDEYSTVICIPSPKQDSLFYALFSSQSSHNKPFKIMAITKSGAIINQKSWTNSSNSGSLHLELKLVNNIPYVFFRDIGRFKLTPSLDLLPKNLSLNQNKPNIYPKVLTDLDKDNWDEWIHWDNKDEITIYNEKRKIGLSFSSPLPIMANFAIYPFFKNHKLEKYMVNTGSGYFFFNYQKNRNYIFLYFIYAFIFGITGGLIFLLLLFQKQNIDKKWNTEKQLSELQFNAVKNQLNPHFMFNALNSVAYMINEGKKEEAYDFLSINARMIQRVMNDAKEVKRPLKDEIQFTKDYISIQKHRFKERFSVEFTINPEIDLKLEVPKMCIHTYVENAIKHGFRNTKTGGVLAITVNPYKNKGVSISVVDNGMGRLAASVYKDSSGNGLNIMNDFYRLFEKYHGYIISCRVVDLSEPVGTKVELRIQVQEKSRATH